MSDLDPIFNASVERLPDGVQAATRCPPLKLLLAHQEGVLPEEASAGIAAHLEQCGLCRGLLADLADGHLEPPGLSGRERDLMRRKLPIPMAAESKNWRWYAVSGALAAALLLCAVLALHTWTSREDQDRTIQTAQLQQSKPHEPPATNREEPQVEVAKLAPPLETAAGLVLRGGGPVGQPSPSQLAAAFDAYAKNDYSTAADRFNLLAKQFPRAEVPVLYLGVTQLLLHDDQAALTSLTRASQLATGETKDAAAWYLAIAAMRTHNPEAAELLRGLCQDRKSAYTEQACVLETKF